MDLFSGSGNLLHVACIGTGLEFLIRLGVFFLPCRLGKRAVVSGCFEHPDLVFHLHHDDSILLAVSLCEMFHQFGVCFFVGLKYVRRESRCYLERFSVCCHGSWKALGVSFEPLRCIAAHGVLPCPKPQEHYFEVVLSGLMDDFVYEREVECAFNGLEQLPVSRHEDGVEAKFLHPWHHAVDIGY